MRDLFVLRSQLVPYIYTAAYMAHVTGVGIVHPIYYEWPEEQVNWLYNFLSADSELMTTTRAPIRSKTSICGDPPSLLFQSRTLVLDIISPLKPFGFLQVRLSIYTQLWTFNLIFHRWMVGMVLWNELCWSTNYSKRLYHRRGSRVCSERIGYSHGWTRSSNHRFRTIAAPLDAIDGFPFNDIVMTFSNFTLWGLSDSTGKRLQARSIMKMMERRMAISTNKAVLQQSTWKLLTTTPLFCS